MEPAALATRSRADIWARAAALLYVGVGAFPEFRRLGGTGIDGSWVVEVARLAGRRAFGEHLAYTYGPLAWLLAPTDVGAHALWASALRFAVVGALLYLAARAAAGTPTWAVVLFAVSQVAALGLGLSFEYQLLLPGVLLGARAVETGRLGLFVALGALAGSGPFLKLTIGVALAGVAAIAAALRAIEDRPRFWRAPIAATGGAVGSALLLGAWTLSSWTALGAWLWRSLEMAAGYSTAMSLTNPGVAHPGPRAAVGGLALAAVLVAGAIGTLHRSPAGVLVLLATPPLFIAFRHAFVRLTPYHGPVFPTLLLAVLGLVVLRAPAGVGRRAAAVGALAAAVMSIETALAYAPFADRQPSLAHVVGGRGAAALGRWGAWWCLRSDLAPDLAADVVPGLSAFTAGKTVGVVPAELALCATNQLDCVPNPTLQTLAGYTASLDRWTADHFDGARAPDVLLLEDFVLEGRIPSVDTPQTWRTLLRHYGVASFQPGRVLVLARRQPDPAPTVREVAQVQMGRGEWARVPATGRRLLLAVDLEPSVGGRAARFLLRVPVVFLGLAYRPVDPPILVRLIPDTASAGLPLDQLAFQAMDLVRLFRGERMPRPYAVTLVGPGTEYFRWPVRIRWLEEADDGR